MPARSALIAAFCTALAAFILAACSGEQVPDAPQPTPSSTERAERTQPESAQAQPARQQQAQSDQQQQAQPAVAQDAQEQQAAEPESEPSSQAEAQEQVEQAEEPPDEAESDVESVDEETITLLPPNVLGDPSASVHIIHFGDFQ